MDGGYTTNAPANFIGGTWQTEPDTMPAFNPATGETIAQLPRSSRETVQRAVAAAKAAAPAWADMPVFKRADICVAMASAIDAAREKIARILSAEQGKVLAEAMGEVRKAADGFRLASELVKQLGGQTLPAEDPTKLVMTIRQPRGVYGVIT
ncbi:MAG: aldehyde dehydrogenase family protein, partial [Mesorhizobium sp.]